jgi:hypothetical protein
MLSRVVAELDGMPCSGSGWSGFCDGSNPGQYELAAGQVTAPAVVVDARAIGAEVMQVGTWPTLSVLAPGGRTEWMSVAPTEAGSRLWFSVPGSLDGSVFLEPGNLDNGGVDTDLAILAIEVWECAP